MTLINKQSSPQKTAAAVEKGLTFILPKQASNYLFKQTSSLNPILSANKKMLGPQKTAWMTATKAALASTSFLGLSYLSYQYLRAKPVPSLSILPNISIGNLLGTTIKVVGSLGLLTLMYSALVNKEHSNPLNNSNPLLNKNNSLETRIMERFEAAKKEFKTNIDEFAEVCEEIIGFLDQPIFPHHFIETFFVSIQKKITNPDIRTSNHLNFPTIVERLFNKLLEINTDLYINSARDIAIRCVNIIINEDNVEPSYLFVCSDKIIRTALQHPRIGFEVAVSCAQQKNNLRCDELSRFAATIFFNKEEDRVFSKFLKEIAPENNENLLESILADTKLIETAAQLKFTTSILDDKTKACLRKIQRIFYILIEAKNFKMATSLLQKCVSIGEKKLQKVVIIWFNAHKDVLLEACPVEAKKLSDHLLESELDHKEENKKEINEQNQETRLLNG